MPTTTLHDDLLRGADAISQFIYGTAEERRKVYHAADRHGLPVFRIGGILHGRKSTILSWIEAQERAAGGARAA